MKFGISYQEESAGGLFGPPALSVQRAAYSRRRRIAWLLSGVLLLAALAVQMGAPVFAAEQAEPPKKHPREKTLMKRQWGVEILFVRSTSAGYMLEFRYRVIDPEKAKPLFERQTKPMLTHVESGAQFVVPTPAKTGALRNSNPPLKDHNYWMFFANPGKYVKPGDVVKIEIGDFVADGIVVE